MHYLTTFTKITGILASLAIFCAFFYENAFIWFLNSNHFPIPLTMSDYTNSFTNWLPSFLIALMGFLFLELVTRRIEKGMTEDEIIATSSNPTFTKKFRDFPDILIKCIVIATMLIYILFGEINLGSNSSTLAMLLSFFWLLIIAPLITNTPLILLRFNRLFILSIFFIPFFMIVFFFNGIGDANKSIHTESPSTIKSEKIIRYYDKGKIILNNKGEIQWCESSDKRSCSTISNKEPKIIIKGIFCSRNHICLPISR